MTCTGPTPTGRRSCFPGPTTGQRRARAGGVAVERCGTCVAVPQAAHGLEGCFSAWRGGACHDAQRVLRIGEVPAGLGSETRGRGADPDVTAVRSRGPRSSGPVPARLRRASRHERRPPEPTPRGSPPFPFWPPPASGSAGHPADRVGLPGPETRRSGLPNRRDPCPPHGGGQPWLQLRHERLRMRATTATGRSMCGRNTGSSITSCHV